MWHSDLREFPGYPSEVILDAWRTFFQKAPSPARLSCSETRVWWQDMVVPRCGIHRREEAGREDLLLPGRARSGAGQGPDRLAALSGLGRGDRRSIVRGRA